MISQNAVKGDGGLNIHKCLVFNGTILVKTND